MFHAHLLAVREETADDHGGNGATKNIVDIDRRILVIVMVHVPAERVVSVDDSSLLSISTSSCSSIEAETILIMEKL